MGGPGRPVYNYPVTPRENIAAAYFEKEPYWIPLPSDSGFFGAKFYNNLLGRGGPDGTVDAFGVQWEWVPVVGGSIVHPGAPLLKNANDWPEVIKFPNLDEIDWQSEANNAKMDPRFSNQMSFVNGFWFERLISFMDFAQAAVALVDEDQQDAIKALFAASTDFACKLVDKFCEYFPALDGFNIHDDWGAQKNPFFSNEIAYDLFVPFMRQLTDHIHSKGRYATLHSCGNVEKRVQCFIDGGIDQWDPQPMNDTQALYEGFGDKIVISVVPDYFDPEKTSEEEQRARARAHVDKFYKPGKPSALGHYAGATMTEAFRLEAYEYSRKKYCGEF